MSQTNEKKIIPGLEPKVPTKSESTSLTVVLGVSNWSPPEAPGLSSCRSMTYTVGASSEPGDHYAGAETPEPFAAGAVRALKSRLRSRVSASNELDASGDF